LAKVVALTRSAWWLHAQPAAYIASPRSTNWPSSGKAISSDSHDAIEVGHHSG